jgi:large repetitive protein
VTVQAATSTLVPTAGNPDSIPISSLLTRESGTSLFSPLSSTTPLQLYQQHTASAPGGETISNDYQMLVPFVRPDTYTTTLNFIVSSQ